jgi:hypothetical protein
MAGYPIALRNSMTAIPLQAHLVDRLMASEKTERVAGEADGGLNDINVPNTDVLKC